MSDTTRQTAASDRDPDAGRPAGGTSVVEHRISTRSIWQVIGSVLLTLAALAVLDRARNLVGMLIISFFFALAIIPLVERLHARRGWKRGAAVGVIYGAGVGFFVVMVVFLIPMIVDLAQLIGENWSAWIDNANEWLVETFGVSISDLHATQTAGENAASATADWSSKALGGILGALSAGVGLIFSLMTISLFTFYFAADHQRIQRAVLSWFSPATQERLGWTFDQAVEQTGGYFYSRLILMLINGGGFFFTLLVVGLDVFIALPLAIIAGFISEFIPAVGTYIGGAIPVMMALALEGFVQALIVLAYVLIYQQVENYWLSPKLSAETMTLNGGVAFGSAIAGGAIAGPMGAFMALPIAALITSFISHYRRPKDVVYTSVYDGDYDGGTDSSTAPDDTEGTDRDPSSSSP
jgi:predicted PurR-regulated permease PerM